MQLSRGHKNKVLFSQAGVKEIRDMGGFFVKRSTSAIVLAATMLCIPMLVEAQSSIDKSFTMKSSDRAAQPVTKKADTLVKRKLCVWDIMGQSGEVVTALKDYQVWAAVQGVELDVKAYVEEKIAAEDFRVGYCDAMVVTGLRARPFNTFTGSIEAVAGLQTTSQMRALVQLLSKPAMANYMQTKFDEQRYEVVGILPFGAAYPFVNNKSINSVEAAAGKKIAIFDYDKAQAKLVKQFGAFANPSDVTNFGAKFNNGTVDIVFTPLVAYRALELYKGMGTKGGIMDYALAQVSLQIVVNQDKFPSGFGQKSREYVAEHFAMYRKLIEGYEKAVDSKYWISISEVDRKRYDLLSRDARVLLVKDGIYDQRMMALMRKIRCQSNPSHAECSMPSE